MSEITKVRDELRQLLTESISEALKKAKSLIRKDSHSFKSLLLLEGRLQDSNLKSIRGIISNEDLQLEYNQIRASLLQVFEALKQSDLADSELKEDEEADRKTGSLLYRIPHKMQRLRETRCIVRLAYDEAVIISKIDLDAAVKIQSIRISNIMMVELQDFSHDPAFRIRGINSPEQFIDSGDFTEWIFQVTPLKEGTHSLVLKIAVIELIYGKERRKEIVLEENIEISAEASANDKSLGDNSRVLNFSLGGEKISPPLPQAEITGQLDKMIDTDGKEIDDLKEKVYPELAEPGDTWPEAPSPAPSPQTAKSKRFPIRTISTALLSVVVLLAATYTLRLSKSSHIVDRDQDKIDYYTAKDNRSPILLQQVIVDHPYSPFADSARAVMVILENENLEKIRPIQVNDKILLDTAQLQKHLELFPEGSKNDEILNWLEISKSAQNPQILEVSPQEFQKVRDNVGNRGKEVESNSGAERRKEIRRSNNN